MQFISVYRLFELVGIDAPKFDVLSIRDLQSKLKEKFDSADAEILKIGEKSITLDEAVEWLWKASSGDTLLFCELIHENPGLEFYLESGRLDNDLLYMIPVSLKKSFHFSRFTVFLRSYLDPKLGQDLKRYLAEKDFDSANQLIEFSQLLPSTSVYEIETIQKQALGDLQGQIDGFVVANGAESSANLDFLSSVGFSIYLSNLDSKFASRKEELTNSISESIGSLNENSDNELAQVIDANLALKSIRPSVTPPLEKFDPTPTINIVKDKTPPKTEYKPKPQEPKQTYSKPMPTSQFKSSKRGGLSGLHIAGIVFGIGVLIAKVAMRPSSDDYEFSSPDFEQQMADLLGDDYDDYDSNLNWDSQISEIRDYAYENEAEKGKVSSMDDWHGDRSISAPFIDFFYPLSNKSGSNGFELVNSSNYSLVLLVKTEEDCYSYFIESKTTNKETFELDEGDELVFYFGKEFEETSDIMEDSNKGFHYVDANTTHFLDLNYIVGSGDDLYTDFDENRDPKYSYSINIEESSGNISVSFDYFREINPVEWWTIEEEDYY